MTISRRHAAWLPLALATVLTAPAAAHDSRLGDLVIDHAYALPTPGGARTGVVRKAGRPAGSSAGSTT